MVTIWGIEFDDNGDVAYMYMADNNDRESYESRGIGCLRLQIVYEPLPEGGTMAMYKSGYIGSMPMPSGPYVQPCLLRP